MQKATSTTGQIDHYKSFRSNFVKARNIEVYLPPGYEPDKRYDVLYMHDGQNVFNSRTSFAGTAWEADKAIESLLLQGRIRPVIIVAIWNSPLRMQEYMPNMSDQYIPMFKGTHEWKEGNLSDQYLEFLVKELKPFIDKNYHTHPGQENSFIMGSSMGGLISMYALAKYPEIFGGAACLSTHWPAFEGAFPECITGMIPQAGNHKYYFDFGTATLDTAYEPYQAKVDSIMLEKGFSRGLDWVSLKFENAAHSEEAWRQRVHVPMEFLFRCG